MLRATHENYDKMIKNSKTDPQNSEKKATLISLTVQNLFIFPRTLGHITTVYKNTNISLVKKNKNRSDMWDIYVIH